MWWTSISMGPASIDSTKLEPKIFLKHTQSYAVADISYLVRPTLIVSVLNMYRHFSCPHSHNNTEQQLFIQHLHCSSINNLEISQSIISNLEIMQSIQEVVHTLYGNIMLFYIKDLSTRGYWSQFPMHTEGHLQLWKCKLCFHLIIALIF